MIKYILIICLFLLTGLSFNTEAKSLTDSEICLAKNMYFEARDILVYLHHES